MKIITIRDKIGIFARLPCWISASGCCLYCVHTHICAYADDYWISCSINGLSVWTVNAFIYTPSAYLLLCTPRCRSPSQCLCWCFALHSHVLCQQPHTGCCVQSAHTFSQEVVKIRRLHIIILLCQIMIHLACIYLYLTRCRGVLRLCDTFLLYTWDINHIVTFCSTELSLFYFSFAWCNSANNCVRVELQELSPITNPLLNISWAVWNWQLQHSVWCCCGFELEPAGPIHRLDFIQQTQYLLN